MKNGKMAVIGGGQMGRALVGGMLAGGVIDAAKVTIVEPSDDSRAWWKENQPKVQTVTDLAAAVKEATLVLLAVKPNIVPIVLEQEHGDWSGKLVISIAAGVSLKSLAAGTGHHRNIRVMPNTPSLVGEGASGFCGDKDVTEEDFAMIQQMLESVGLAVRVEEYQMDAVTGLSGSGPAYVCLMIEALADGGVLAGLPRPLAMKLATQTVFGSAKMVAETGCHPGELKDAVASPGGTTIAALKVLEANGLRAALIQAVAASAERSKELGN